jgi:hypothetical protein
LAPALVFYSVDYTADRLKPVLPGRKLSGCAKR